MTGRRAAEFLCLLAGFTLLTALFFWQTLPHLDSALLGPAEDNLQDFWNSWYAAKGHQGAFFFTHLIRAPEGVSLYYHSFAYPQIAAVWALSKIFGTSLPTLITLQNLTILASFPLAGTGAFYLCRYLGGGIAGSAAGGFIFAFNPWHVAQAMHHAHVAGIEFLPAFVLCYLLASDRKSLPLAGRRDRLFCAERPVLLVLSFLLLLFSALPSALSARARKTMAARLAAGGAGAVPWRARVLLLSPLDRADAAERLARRRLSAWQRHVRGRPSGLHRLSADAFPRRMEQRPLQRLHRQ